MKFYQIEKLKPLTTFIGKLEIEHYRPLFEKKSAEQIAKFLESNPLKAVKGPEDLIYVVDPLHTILALPKSYNKKIPVLIVDDFSDQGGAKFLTKVTRKFKIYPKDRKGHLVKFQNLSNSIYNLRDDPYSSLLALLIRNKHYPPFASAEEFFNKSLRLRDQIPGMKPTSLKELSEYQPRALEVLQETVLLTPIAELKPTQLCLGQLEIEVKTKYLAKMSEVELDAYMKRNFFLGVLDSKKEVHLIDGHHKVRSLLNLGIKQLLVTIVEDYSNLPQTEFWKILKERKFVYLKDNEGQAATIAQLPQNFDELINDPYRSLAWFIRKNKIYLKDDRPFQEFEWADYLRKALPYIDLKTKKDVKKNSKEILKAVYAKEALGLRGHQGNLRRITELDTDIY